MEAAKRDFVEKEKEKKRKKKPNWKPDKVILEAPSSQPVHWKIQHALIT